MPAEFVLAEPHDGVLTITINRPAQKNAVNHEVAVQLAAAVDRLDADPRLSVGGRPRPAALGGRAHRRRWHVLRGDGSEGLRRGRAADAPGPRVRRPDASGG